MTAILPSDIETPKARPARVGLCCRAFFRVMAGDGSEQETASNSLQFATWMLALAATLSAAGVLGTLTFAFSTSKTITRIETRQEDFLNRIVNAMEESKEMKRDQEKMNDEIQKIKQHVGSIRLVLQMKGANVP